MLQGFAISNAIRRLDIAGHEVTQQLRKQLVEAGYELGNAADLEPVRRMKEKLCFLSVPEAPAEVTPTPDAQRVYHGVTTGTAAYHLRAARWVQGRVGFKDDAKPRGSL